MEQHHLRRTRRSTAIGLAALLAIGTIVAPRATATPSATQARLAGTDRFATAAAIAKASYPSGTSSAILASGRAFPDALAGAALGQPILLTERDTLPPVTKQALTDLKVKDVTILGGTAAVSKSVESQLPSGVTVTRIAGNDRYETAAAIAKSIGAAKVATLKTFKTALIATGADFADALAGGPLAASGAGTTAYPVLLVGSDVPPSTKDAISSLGIQQVVILGGTGAVSSAVQAELESETGHPAVRLAGTNRFGTAVKVATSAITDFGFKATEVLVANAFTFADALAGGPLGTLRSAPIVLTDAERLTDDSSTVIADHADTIATVTALGGTAAVSESTLSEAKTAAQTPAKKGTNESYKVAPA
ncbi:MAG: hypothetical protein QOI47_649, partial [Actinomycetota bacterium]|nr:hypothetical protein [Actinomycetota bacterium]